MYYPASSYVLGRIWNKIHLQSSEINFRTPGFYAYSIPLPRELNVAPDDMPQVSSNNDRIGTTILI